MIRLLIFALIGSIFGALLDRCVHDKYREEAIKHGAAHYDQKTGKFTWNDERKTP